jgi:thiol-disulfide isomerase/thioredoxin
VGRRSYLVLAAVLVVLAIGAVVFATRTDPSSLGGGTTNGDKSKAPALDAKGWINTAPLRPADLKGKVVVYDFWTYSCVNCVRTIPYVRGWYDRYRKDGLVVIGVHSPEFDFEKVHANVRRAVHELGVDYPVALDDEMDIWTAFANQYWPADYIYGRDGRQASVHFGEGDYAATENELRRLLGVEATSPRSTPHGHQGGSATTPGLTDETYNGSERGQVGYASAQPLVDGENTFTVDPKLPLGNHGLAGRWMVSGQYVESGAPGAAIVLGYHAGQVNLVMSTAKGQPVDVQVQVDDRAPTTVRVTEPDLYSLVRDAKPGSHTLRLTATAPGLRAFAFTFGG